MESNWNPLDLESVPFQVELKLLKRAVEVPMEHAMLMVAPWVLVRLTDVWATALLHLGNVYDAGDQYRDDGHVCMWAYCLPALLMSRPGTTEGKPPLQEDRDAAADEDNVSLII